MIWNFWYATSVDYYQLHEAIDFFSDHWLSTLARACTNKAAGYGCQYPLQKLWINWVFQDARTFKRMSGSFVQAGTDGFDSSDGSDTSTEIMKEKVDQLPIPSSILDTIKLYRNHIISDTIEVIHELITKYSETETCCTASTMVKSSRRSCDAIALGYLIKGAQSAKIWSMPTQPYDFSYEVLTYAIRSLKVKSLCCSDKIGSPGTHDAHAIMSHIMLRIKNAPCITKYDESQDSRTIWPLDGLEINDFLPKDRNKKRG
ncbi:uncharacterized protein RCO7_00915 [Rhynchosporium graminicola]|uniref:Uncharacterized protein n=1 Tax=Rhynchosporium graminicola TaxID=2792576 RepID=A0A1E1JQ95_9HELO|nr:uncharacterized protein RCO7_00915 [Rhynchosporium commune]